MLVTYNTADIGGETSKLNAGTLQTSLKTVSIIRCLWRKEYKIEASQAEFGAS